MVVLFPRYEKLRNFCLHFELIFQHSVISKGQIKWREQGLLKFDIVTTAGSAVCVQHGDFFFLDVLVQF